MNKFCKMLLAAAAVVALAAPAMAADKLIVKDSAGTGTSFKVTDDGRMGLGGDPLNIFDVIHEWPGVATTNLVTSISVYKDQARYAFRRANGTPSAPAALASGDTIGNLNFRGYNGSDWNPGASAGIVVQAEEAFTPTTGAGRMMFFTQASGVTPTGGNEKFRIAGDGRLRISNQPAAPANNATCVKGDLILDATNGFLYLCTATNSWKRAAFAAY